MRIEPYKAEVAAGLAQAYNEAFRRVPLCYPVGAEDFAAAVASAESLHGGPPLHSLAAFVATDRGSVRGFIQAGVRPPTEGREAEQGMIRLFWYEPGRRAAGHALLDAAEDYLRRQGVACVEACHQDYTFSFCQMRPCYLSERLGQVQALLLLSGYRKAGSEVLLTWPDFEPIAPPPLRDEAEVAVTWRETPGRRPTATVKAMQDGRRVGECACIRVGDYSDDERARDWFFTIWIGVDDESQGRGLGKHLLRRALVEMRGAGYRHAAISTAAYNHRAFVFYSNFGYHVADWTYGYARNL